MPQEPDPSWGLTLGLRNQGEGQGLVPRPGATLVTLSPFPLNALPQLDRWTLICPQCSGSGHAISLLRAPTPFWVTEGKRPSIGQKKSQGREDRILLFLKWKGDAGKGAAVFWFGLVWEGGREGVLL